MNNASFANTWSNAFRIEPGLLQSSRIALSRTGDRSISIADIAILLAAGSVAALAVGLVHLRVGVPGHAILQAVVPMALGLALVPRRSAGMTMALGAGVTSAVMSVGRIGFFPPAAMLSVLALGPVLDLALVGNPQGWRLYLRFVLAGAAANLLAYALKLAGVWLGWEAAGGGNFARFGAIGIVLFAACGAAAGLISAALWFRLHPMGTRHDALRRP
jgi:hypothetical protein